MGGLGNQLFIYGAGLAAARASGTQLRVDTSQHAARPDRAFQLQQLGFPAEYVDLGKGRVAGSRRGRLSRLLHPAEHVPRGCSLTESGFGYDERVLHQAAGSCIFGYFQSWRYVTTVADELRSQLRRLGETRAEHLAVVASLLDDPASIAMHVRRGDYVQMGVKEYHGIAGSRFYRDALGTLRRMGFDGPVYLFSDDVPSALRELSDLPGLRSPVAHRLAAVDELLLMSRASALITANSSFSWWAGWLGDRPDRPVLAPRPWFDNPQLDGRDILPPHWLTLDRRDI